MFIVAPIEDYKALFIFVWERTRTQITSFTTLPLLHLLSPLSLIYMLRTPSVLVTHISSDICISRFTRKFSHTFTQILFTHSLPVSLALLLPFSPSLSLFSLTLSLPPSLSTSHLPHTNILCT